MTYAEVPCIRDSERSERFEWKRNSTIVEDVVHYFHTTKSTMGPAKKEKTAPSGRDLMTAQQKKDADIANMGAKAALKATSGGDAKPKNVDIGAQKSAANGGKQKVATDLSFLDASVPKKK